MRRGGKLARGTVLATLVGLLAADTHAAEAPLRLVGRGLIVVPVLLEGRGPYPFLVDTGSTISVVSEQLARELELRPARSAARVVTLGGRQALRKVRVGGIGLAGEEVGERVVAVANLDALRRRSLLSLGGILGNDVLSEFDVVLDYADRRFKVIRFCPGWWPS